jgi:hypothetical protein
MNDNVLYHSLCAAKDKNKADVISPTAFQTDGAKPLLRFAWDRMPKLAVEATPSTRFCSSTPEVIGLSGTRTNRSVFELVDNSALRGKDRSEIHPPAGHPDLLV